MQHTVIGDTSQCVVAQMTNGDEIRAALGSMILLSDGIALEAGAAPAGHTGAQPELESYVPLTHIRCVSALGVVTFAAPCTGEVRELELAGGTWLCSPEAFLYCTGGVAITVGHVFQVDGSYLRQASRLLYRVGGLGTVFIHCGGNALEYTLAPEQRVSVDAACVMAFQSTVTHAMEMEEGLISPQGLPEAMLLITLTGPGKIYLATLPLSRIRRATETKQA